MHDVRAGHVGVVLVVAEEGEGLQAPRALQLVRPVVRLLEVVDGILVEGGAEAADGAGVGHLGAVVLEHVLEEASLRLAGEKNEKLKIVRLPIPNGGWVKMKFKI